MKNFSPTWIKQIKLIAWDLDGTLYPPMPEVSEQINRVRVTAIAKLLRLPLSKAQAKFDSMYRQLHSTTRVLNELKMGGEQFFIDFWENFDLSNYIQPDPELQEIFVQAKAQGREHALLTNANTLISVQKKLAAIGLAPALFSAIFASGRTGIHKPTPEAFKQLWEQTPFAMEEIVYVGDKENTDIVPAKNLGLKTVLMDWLIKGEEPQADLLVHSPKELLAYFI